MFFLILLPITDKLSKIQINIPAMPRVGFCIL